MKLQILLLGILLLALLLWLGGVMSADIALSIMGIGVGVLFYLSERKTR